MFIPACLFPHVHVRFAIIRFRLKNTTGNNMEQQKKWPFWLAWIPYVLILFEMLYMATPFAVFFYGAYGLPLRILNSDDRTAWLIESIFPHFVHVRSPFINAALVISYPLMAVGLVIFVIGFAQIYWSKAMLESNSAQTSYASGNFADAKVHYHAMDDFINQAFSTESIKGSNAADSVTIQANAAQIQSFGFLLLGFGVSLLGGGVIIYGLRSSKSK